MKRLSAQSGLAMREIGDDAMAVLQAHTWPGNVRQLRNIVERLLILATDDAAQAVISADLLPADLGSSAPWGGGRGGDLVISLPLREAREIFERDYLVAQINRFGGNISRTAAFIGMERSALHRKLKSLGVGPNGREQGFNAVTRIAKWDGRPHRRAASPMSMAAMSRMASAGVHIEDRGLQLGDGVYEVCAVVDGALMDVEEHLDRLVRSVGEIEMAMPMPRDALKLVMREVVRRNAVRDGLLYLQVTRGAVRRDHPIPDTGQPRPSLILTARAIDAGAIWRSGASTGIAVDLGARTNVGGVAISRPCSFCPTCWPRPRRGGRARTRPGWWTGTGSSPKELVDHGLDRVDAAGQETSGPRATSTNDITLPGDHPRG